MALVATLLTPSSFAGKTHTVEIIKLKFEPAILFVEPGDKVTFINRDIVPHTATADNNSWDTGHLEKNQSATIEFNEGMTLAYYCFYHRNMKGQFEYQK